MPTKNATNAPQRAKPPKAIPTSTPQTTTPTDQPKPKRPYYGGGRKSPVNKVQAIAMREAGCTMQTIANAHGVTPSAIYRNMKDLPALNDFRAHKDTAFESLQHRIMQTIDEETIKQAPLLARVTAIGIAEDKIRLFRGQATSNINVLVGYIQDLQGSQSGGD